MNGKNTLNVINGIFQMVSIVGSIAGIAVAALKPAIMDEKIQKAVAEALKNQQN